MTRRHRCKSASIPWRQQLAKSALLLLSLSSVFLWSGAWSFLAIGNFDCRTFSFVLWFPPVSWDHSRKNPTHENCFFHCSQSTIRPESCQTFVIEIWSQYPGARSKFLKILPIFSIDLLNISQEYFSLHDWIWYLCCERWNLCTTFWFKLGPQALCLFFVFGYKCGCRFLAQVDFKHFNGANGKTLVDYFAIAVRPFSSSSHIQIHDIHTKYLDSLHISFRP